MVNVQKLGPSLESKLAGLVRRAARNNEMSLNATELDNDFLPSLVQHLQ